MRKTSPDFKTIFQQRLNRRDLLKGTAKVGAAGTVLGSMGLSACNGGRSFNSLGFAAIAASKEDFVTLPAGYSAKVVFALGDPLRPNIPEYSNVGTEADFADRAGDHHDGMNFFPLPAGTENSDRGLLVMNHENISQDYLHIAGATSDASGNRPSAEVRKEISAHGLSVVEVQRSGGSFETVRGSSLNRRITPETLMQLSGPVAGSDWVKTVFDPNGLSSRGTINNCANGYTPWGTSLTCEENWHGYFKTQESEPGPEVRRYGIGDTSSFGWETAAGAADEAQGQFARWNITPSGANATDDYRNEANTFGWVVEFDPYNPNAAPIKRTAMGRFRHEGCWPSLAKIGQPLAFYMGDDNRGDYIYKFVTAQTYLPGVSNGSMLDNGTLYAAKFDANGRGRWLPLTLDNPVLASAYSSMAELLVNTRSAADLAGATPMDRPEWAAVNPDNGEVYMTLTNNSNRGNSTSQPVDAANPRNYNADADADLEGNHNGHIIRWREDDDRADATSFMWDIFLFGAAADAAPEVNVSTLTQDNALSSPDGLWFDQRRNNGILWIQTDDSALKDYTNNQVLAAVPGRVADGSVTKIGDQVTYVGAPLGDDLRRFAVGPKECEITGIATTPDGTAMFINIQHPGENGGPQAPSSNWPSASRDATQAPEAGTRPRSATIVITRDDGGLIGE